MKNKIATARKAGLAMTMNVTSATGGQVHRRRINIWIPAHFRRRRTPHFAPNDGASDFVPIHYIGTTPDESQGKQGRHETGYSGQRVAYRE